VIDKLDIRRAMQVGGHRGGCSDKLRTWASTGSGRLEQQACGRGFIEPIGGSSIIDLYNASGTSTNAASPTARPWASGGCRPPV
jgi:hypothetical protein